MYLWLRRHAQNLLSWWISQHCNCSLESFYTQPTNCLVAGSTQERPDTFDASLLGLVRIALFVIVVHREALSHAPGPLTDVAPAPLCFVEEPVLISGNPEVGLSALFVSTRLALAGDHTVMRSAPRTGEGGRALSSNTLGHAIFTRFHLLSTNTGI